MDNITFEIIEDPSELFPEEIEPVNTEIQKEIEKLVNSPVETPAPAIPMPIPMSIPTPPIKICILTPCFAGQCNTNYVISLMNTIEFFRKIGIEMRIEFCKNDSLVSRARNNLIAKAMTDPSITHMMFIDNDITWNPSDIMKLILSNKELIGGIYPLKHYEWSRLMDPKFIQRKIQRKTDSSLKDHVTDENMIKHNLLRYNVNYLNPLLHIEQNLAKVKHIATGFMLIQRSCIEKMMKRYFYTKYTDDVAFLEPHENKMAYALFDCGVCDNHYYSEDWMFCDRWSKMDGEIWIDVTVNLVHSGPHDFEGSYIASII